MKQSLQTNKLLKGGIILGDLCILNLLFLLLCHVFNEATLGSVFVDSLPQILVLLNLVWKSHATLTLLAKQDCPPLATI